MEERNKKILDELLDEIEIALKDPKGIVAHKRRLAFALSLGAVSLIENYLNNKSFLKRGAKINHRWFKKKKENVRNLISEHLISSIDNLEKIDSILDKVFDLEKREKYKEYTKELCEDVERNYGQPNITIIAKSILEN